MTLSLVPITLREAQAFVAVDLLGETDADRAAQAEFADLGREVVALVEARSTR